MQLSLFNNEEDKQYEEQDFFLCIKCEVEKHSSAFPPSFIEYKNREKGVYEAYKTYAGTASWCRECRAAYNNTLYHLNKQYKKHKPLVDYPCECCGKMTDPTNLQLDHDHITGLFRGWLCKKCNTGIGTLGDTLESVQKAVAYLERTNEQH